MTARRRTCPGCAREHQGHTAYCARCRRALRERDTTPRAPRRDGYTLGAQLAPKPKGD